MARKREEELEIPAEEAAVAPAEPRVESATRRPKEPKIKATYSLGLRLKRLVDSTAADLDLDSSELVTKLLTAGLRGVSRPTIPADLRRQLGQERETAA